MEGGEDGNSIRVVVRCRPFNARELDEGGAAEAALGCSEKSIKIQAGGEISAASGKTFSYDRVFGSDATQGQVFEAVGVRLLENALDAYNGCVFAYGQTGAGKSHSVVGDVHSDAGQGILPRACTRLFEMICSRKETDAQFQAMVLASYLEIYNEKLFDLLSSGRDSRAELQVRSHPTLGALVAGLTECPVQNFQDALELLDFGAKRRAVGATQMNATSSRSHAVFTLQIRMAVATGGGSVESQAKLHFVDLAGSERQKKTGAEGSRLKEGIGINQSLTTLGRVISELTKPGGTKSVPAFRDSKLTLLLKDALMGNSRTELLACVSPALSNLEETVGTMEFASRCKLVKTSARKNEQSKVDVIAKLTSEKGEIEALLRQERMNSQGLITQLQAQLEKAAEKQRTAELALSERRRIEERLRQLEVDSEEVGERRARRNSILEPAPANGLTTVGRRVCVSERCTAGAGRLTATVCFAGETDFASGPWVGVALDKPVGKNDGLVNGRRYFQCEPQHGLFIRPNGCLPLDMLEELQDEGPGEYRLATQAKVSEGAAIGSAELTELRKGMYVKVLEVVRSDEEQMVRGRIEEPAGWITLFSMQDQQRLVMRDKASSSSNAIKHRASINQYHMKLAQLEQQERRLQQENQQEQELRARLERERKVQEEREQDLKGQIDALKGLQESYALDQAQIDAKREQQQRQREAELAKLGMHFMDIELEDMPTAPKLVNLHPDPALKGCLVYCLPLGETRIGSDGDRCRVALSGLNIGAEVCAVVNQGNEHLMLRPLSGGISRVNGRVVSSEGCPLEDGDRLAIGRAYIFQVQVPLAAGRGGSNRCRVESDDFERAMEEITKHTEVDPLFQNGIEKAMMLVKSDFGPEAASQLLSQARRASEACVMANGVLHQMPERWRSGVSRFELSIMFDAHGLPEVCVAARRAAATGAGEDSSTPVSGDFRSGGLSAGIWEIEHFWTERLPMMMEALSDSGLGGSMLEEVHEEPTLERWEARVWGEISPDDYRRLCHQNVLLVRRLQKARQDLGDIQARFEMDSACGSRGAANGVFGKLWEVQGAATDWLSKRTGGAGESIRPTITRSMSGSKLLGGSSPGSFRRGGGGGGPSPAAAGPRPLDLGFGVGRKR